MTIKDFFSLKKNFFFWGNLLLMTALAVALVVGVFKWLDTYTRHDVAVTVPDVEGMKLDEADAILRKHALVAVVSDSTYNTSRPGGIVLDMNPVAGSVVKDGRTIYLTVNTGRPPMREIPDLIDNSSLREAVARLQAMGFVLAENDSVEGEPDWVYGIKYKDKSLQKGDKVPAGAELVLQVGCDMLQADTLLTEEVPVEIPSEVQDDSWFE